MEPQDALSQVVLPADVWQGRQYTNIYASVLFADLENSVQISRIVSPADYDALIDEFQHAMLRAAEELQPALKVQIGEIAVAGDQLALFFYDEQTVRRNFLLDGPDRPTEEERLRLIKDYRRSNEELALNALRAGVYLKNSWLINPINVERVKQHREPYGLAIGIHIGKVFLRQRSDGRRRIEGFTVNMAKRVESFSRQGRFSRIMLSQAACNMIRGMVRGHTQLRQRIFFHEHTVDSDMLKGLNRTEICELKFIYNVHSLRPSEQSIELYKQIFAIDDTNIWAYYQLSDYYRQVKKDWDKVEELARRAYLAHPHDEVVLFDFAQHCIIKGLYDQAREYCLQALKINSDMDLIYERLAEIYDATKDYSRAVEVSRRALLLSPASPINQYNMALTLCDVGQFEEAAQHLTNAVLAFPEFAAGQSYGSMTLKYLGKIVAAGAATPRLREVLAGLGPEYLVHLGPAPSDGSLNGATAGTEAAQPAAH